jgi:hypothetical protein
MKFFALMAMLLAVTPGTPSPVPSHPAATPSPGVLSPDDLFSRRALRRARLLIQMRLMQLHDERLECVREALLRQLPAALWPEVPSPTRGSPDLSTVAARCADLLRF